MQPHGHSKSDARNLALHHAAMEKLWERPAARAAVMALIEAWLADEAQRPSRHWIAQWRDMLSTWPPERVAALVLHPEEGQVLRQCSPLAPVLAPRERWAVLDEVRRRGQLEAARTKTPQE